jgi:TolB-like protein
MRLVGKMNKKNIGIICACVLLLLTGCGGGGKYRNKAFLRENVSLEHIKTIAVLPFEGGERSPRIREFTMTQVLVSGLFDVVDKGRVDYLLGLEAIAPGAPIDNLTIRRLGQQLKVEAVLFGSVEEDTLSRGSAVFPEITMTLRLVDCETGLLLWQGSGKGSGYSMADRLFGAAPEDSFEVTMGLLENLFATLR